jgi:hypothetical protein
MCGVRFAFICHSSPTLPASPAKRGERLGRSPVRGKIKDFFMLIDLDKLGISFLKLFAIKLILLIAIVILLLKI